LRPDGFFAGGTGLLIVFGPANRQTGSNSFWV
jgi:hypothetical protein